MQMGAFSGQQWVYGRENGTGRPRFLCIDAREFPRVA